MKDITRKILIKALESLNLPDKLISTGEINITPVRFAAYHKASFQNQRQIHDELQTLERNGFLSINWKRVAIGEEDTITGIVVLDTRKLLLHMGISIASDEVARAIAHLEKIRENSLPHWLEILIKDEIIPGWLSGKKPFRRGPEKVTEFIDAIALLAWLCRQEMLTEDVRTVSVRLFGNSKRIEDLSGLVASMFKDQLPQEMLDGSSMEILEYLGLAKHPTEIRIAGKVVILSGEDCNTYLPPKGSYIALPADSILSVRATRDTNYVLTIENLTTFNRYVREITVEGLVIYTGGFPSRPMQKILKSLFGQLPERCPIYHWGDIDAGGYRILSFLQTLSGKVHPWLMDQETSCRYGRRNPAISNDEFERFVPGLNRSLADFLDKQRGMGVFHRLEQESIPLIEAVIPVSKGSF